MCCCGGRGQHDDRWGWRDHGHRHEHGHGHWHEHEHEHEHGPGREHGPDEECGPPEEERWHEHRDERRGPPPRDGGECGCGDEREGWNWDERYPFGFRRHFHSRGEEIEFLRRYLEGLEQEAAAVREIIALATKPPEEPKAPASEPPPEEPKP